MANLRLQVAAQTPTNSPVNSLKKGVRHDISMFVYFIFFYDSLNYNLFIVNGVIYYIYEGYLESKVQFLIKNKPSQIFFKLGKTAMKTQKLSKQSFDEEVLGQTQLMSSLNVEKWQNIH